MDVDFNAILNTVTVTVLVAIAAWTRKFLKRTNDRIDSWDMSVKKIDQHLEEHRRDRQQLNRIEDSVQSDHHRH